MKRPDYLASGEFARLIPVATKPELRNTSVTSAILMAVEEFAEALLGPLGAPIGKRAKTQVWVEPVFKSANKENKDRPDALVIVDNGRREWRALVEAKAKGADLDASQIERYLDIAKVHGVDAVVTISNQFVATPTQSPCSINRHKLNKFPYFIGRGHTFKPKQKFNYQRAPYLIPTKPICSVSMFGIWRMMQQE